MKINIEKKDRPDLKIGDVFCIFDEYFMVVFDKKNNFFDALNLKDFSLEGNQFKCIEELCYHYNSYKYVESTLSIEELYY